MYDLSTYWRTAGGNFTTIPQYFKDNGYLTAGMGKIYHPGSATGSDDPISWSDDYEYYHSPSGGDYGGRDASWWAVMEEEVRAKPLPDQDLTQHAINVMTDARHGDRPFFVAVGYQKPHLPFVFPESYLDLYPAEDIGLAVNNFAPENLPEEAWNTYGELRGYGDIKDMESEGVTGALGTLMPDDKARELRRAYYAAMSYIDGEIGTLLSELNTLGLADNTIVSVIGDHGWHLGDHSGWG